VGHKPGRQSARRESGDPEGSHILRGTQGNFKVAHSRSRPIVGNIFNDREAWTAVGAIYERILVPPVPRVKQFSQAVVASSDVCCNRNKLLALVSTFQNDKIGKIDRRQVVAAFNGVNGGKGWRI